MKKIREWLADYFATIDGNEMEKILADVGERMVNSFEEGRRQVNAFVPRTRLRPRTSETSAGARSGSGARSRIREI